MFYGRGLLNKLAAMLSEDDQIPKTEIKDMLHKIEEQQDHTIMAINRLESSYRQKKEEALADKVSDEVDDLLEQIDRETRPARLILVSCPKVKSRPGSLGEGQERKRQNKKRVYGRISLNGKSNRIVNKFNARKRSFTL